MNANNRQEVVAKLQSLVDRIPSLEGQRRFSEDFKKWANDAKIALKWIFKDDPSAVTELETIKYTLGAYSSGTPDSAFEDAFRRGLSSARALLQARVDEIQEFWVENGPEPAIKPEPATPKDPGLVFVIHVRQGLGTFHDFLRAIGLKPLEWSQARRLTAKPNPYTWEIVDTALNNAGAIVALLTADDEARLRQDLWTDNENALEKELLFQPRQNVLFEAGVAYGRSPNRTVLVRVGSHRPMSDLAGHHIIILNNSPESRQSVADALNAAGCPVDLSGSDWFRAGDFS
jgi:predicted nucleotide-binding protein